MRRTWASIEALAALLGLFAGCYSTDRPRIKPPKLEEVYALPPADDPKYDNPLKYPDGTLNQDSIKRARDAKAMPQPGMGGGGPMGGGMGGPGGR